LAEARLVPDIQGTGLRDRLADPGARGSPMTRAIDNFSNGSSAPPRSGRRMDVLEPATGQAYASVADSDVADVDAAVAAARAAFPAWSAWPAPERSLLLHKLADLIDRNLDR